ncbi:MAG: LysR substrate-binding domain-containing protein [Magnetospirillum sp.]|nr:LysR substrate-binding domain-containing protein [Magnetospirillum sp.]
MRPVPLNDLEAFAAVARRRSFRRAAAERGVSASLLSQTVRRLEERLGVALLLRTTRSVSLTQAGEVLLAGLDPALARIDQAVEALNDLRGRPSGRLRLNAPLPVVHLTLAPLAAGFMAAYPDVQLEITADDAFSDVLGQGFDAGVRFGEDMAQDMVTVPLHRPCRRLVVAAPATVERVGRPRTPRDLAGLGLIAHRFPGGAIYGWEFAKEGEALTVTPTGSLVCNDPLLQVRAALDGAGFAFVFEEYVRAEVDAGRLVSVLEDWAAPMPAPFLYFSSRRTVSAPLRAFIDYVRARS